VSKFTKNPQQTHLKVAQQILKYIKRMLEYGILYLLNNELVLIAHNNVDWAHDLFDKCFTTKILA
jgi:hypothetical protein